MPLPPKNLVCMLAKLGGREKLRTRILKMRDAGNTSHRRGGHSSSEEEEETEQEKSCNSDSGDEIAKAGTRRSGSSSSSSSDMDLELGLGQNAEIEEEEEEEEEEEKQLHLGNNVEERDCRICHLSLDESPGFPIDLGCSCKDDLAAAHKHCAEAWFKIKGNKTGEICGSVARNVAGATEAETVVEQGNEGSGELAVATSTGVRPAAEGSSGGRHFWQGDRLLNFLVGCVVSAFVISWLFYFNVPS